MNIVWKWESPVGHTMGFVSFWRFFSLCVSRLSKGDDGFDTTVFLECSATICKRASYQPFWFCCCTHSKFRIENFMKLKIHFHRDLRIHQRIHSWHIYCSYSVYVSRINTFLCSMYIRLYILYINIRFFLYLPSATLMPSSLLVTLWENLRNGLGNGPPNASISSAAGTPCPWHVSIHQQLLVVVTVEWCSVTADEFINSPSPHVPPLLMKVPEQHGEAGWHRSYGYRGRQRDPDAGHDLVPHRVLHGKGPWGCGGRARRPQEEVRF